MQKDIVVTIFSRRKGKTTTLNLNRRLLAIVLLVLLTMAAAAPVLFHLLLQERRERQQLAEKLAGVELEVEDATQVELPPVKEMVSEQVQEPAEEKNVEEPVNPQAAEPPTAGTPTAAAAADTSAEPVPYARVESPRLEPLEQGSGFRLSFKLANAADSPISGKLVIIASLKPPHQPRYVSYPYTELTNGEPRQPGKLIRFTIRNFKYMAAKFRFPFSWAESFRVAIFDAGNQPLFNQVIPAEEVDTSLLTGE
ncbi:MAG: hypothetical protein JRJ12_00875 [Deltaproteobacteria bacterium]|nr:hypothetical protein [Deltaproteobacteria bacterium]MBW2070023.1 hypothetical protein [Deltaproteobacteria bacterium]